MDTLSLTTALKQVKEHYFYCLYGLKPHKKYVPLDSCKLVQLENIIERDAIKIWNKDFWGLSISDSISYTAGTTQIEINTIRRLKRDISIQHDSRRNKL